MKGKNLSRYWPLTLLLAGLALFLLLLIGSSPVQAGNSSQGSALTATITIPPSTAPAATLVGPTVVIPQTGGETAYGDFFSSWVLWVVLGLLLIVLLVALVMRPRGPVDPGSS
jgi:hypothetical protein